MSRRRNVDDDVGTYKKNENHNDNTFDIVSSLQKEMTELQEIISNLRTTLQFIWLMGLLVVAFYLLDVCAVSVTFFLSYFVMYGIHYLLYLSLA